VRTERHEVYEYDYDNEETPVMPDSFRYDSYQSSDSLAEDMVEENDTTFFVASD
jgi:hypothetical protein